MLSPRQSVPAARSLAGLRCESDTQARNGDHGHADPGHAGCRAQDHDRENDVPGTSGACRAGGKTRERWLANIRWSMRVEPWASSVQGRFQDCARDRPSSERPAGLQLQGPCRSFDELSSTWLGLSMKWMGTDRPASDEMRPTGCRPEKHMGGMIDTGTWTRREYALRTEMASRADGVDKG